MYNYTSIFTVFLLQWKTQTADTARTISMVGLLPFEDGLPTFGDNRKQYCNVTLLYELRLPILPVLLTISCEASTPPVGAILIGILAYYHNFQTIKRNVFRTHSKQSYVPIVTIHDGHILDVIN
jgi:hypothetical protein